MEIATTIAPIGLAIIMLTLGFGLTIQDFLRVFKMPKDFLIGFICQLILLPVLRSLEFYSQHQISPLMRKVVKMKAFY